MAVTRAYKILTDPVKRARWMNSEDPDFSPLQSDTETLTDADGPALLAAPGATWLVLAYADWSSESWDLAERWEQLGRDLGRYMRVGRVNVERERGLARRFNALSVPMIYAHVDGRVTAFHGEPTPGNVTLFLAKALADAVAVVRDASAGGFLGDLPHRTKAPSA